MIITKQKPIAEIIDYIKNDSSVFLIGCAVCATTCKTGGETEIKLLSELLIAKGKNVTGWDILNPACYILESKKLLRRKEKEISAAESIISLACGGGTQAIAEMIGKSVYPANDTLFQGEIIQLSPQEDRFEKKCLMCGECIVGVTGGICPVTRCPKGLRSGPCGGVNKGKCEVDPERDCAWVLIYNRLKELGQLGNMGIAGKTRDYSNERNYILVNKR
ncbi:MAG: methylenetetrahydrofolate reductase C-terminal domain-containing protein [Candidatus Omnitrophota bacterium]|nr:methylenetetrahydrofolate reductase C-terminal domain-containing protein [Candidatus Omnitrophota bacterium]MBU1928794.1 methylenetetrahydrofolate reductase C-terminal domain-containing protein [Candidatus Omnitrophota bacterium]MBU2034253.1 methylenetetrahydrofolate reductase C-terminal domain-containing protein [Candidatus Omnitrophota bacterium]MBU2221517.1 methylenetetrahydrofolate reductase C-terminal domain-containing protein [Candidatus Omnitrophota bacterium]